MDRINKMDRIREAAASYIDTSSLLNLDNPVNPVHCFPNVALVSLETITIEVKRDEKRKHGGSAPLV
jgi:hypothetical protein